MNKQELIDILENLECSTESLSYDNGYEQGVYDSLSHVILLDEPKKVVIPKFVADELEKLADKYLTLRDIYTGDVHWLNNGTVYLEGKELELAKWFYENETTFEYAWIHGYEVETEQLYYVKMPLTEWNDDTSELETKYVYLTEDITSEEIRLQASNAEHGDWKVKLTEERVKGIDERYWPFAVKVDGE
ncbi:DUF1642 domain-containing protein [Enterococcus faecalis]|uniref:DUF1642 domain-containing protein n=1 Tax=Enterococcus faecalis TaxID=1351 RepID=UPI0015747D0E|nr:DUF1642 domain-containing protein [Enterococcus faecalis]EGO7897246.1 DUF1642 domain-containing protein [Enterococcus faecalis]EGO8565514.1 DUF1642 domain-containing protein [Enterococcus faecalis]EIQ7138302.1 DUF1642 domain-containing protein [Enterococcus faecalis]EIX6402429.1 DUF1642 domain-containing protein [Enterococcus faecalis]EKZ0452979.1 DUF1642 domain-containing protein [Enterococcus faecalis]